jgi:guanylate kinase
MPPSVNELSRRLHGRGTDTPEKIRMRVEKAASELNLAGSFDRIIINDNLEEACRETVKVVTDFLKD